MALSSNSEFPKEIHYRRGAVMGLTVAEAFMLVAFILMMMLLFWRIAIEEETKDRILLEQISSETIKVLIENPEIRNLVLVVQKLPENTRRKLGDLVRRPNVDEVITVAEKLSEADRATLRRGARPVDPQRLEDLGAAAELAGRFKAAGIPIEKIEDLADVLRNHSVEDIEEALAIARELSEADRAALRRGARPVDPQRLEDLGAAAELAGRFRAAGIPIEKIEDLADVLRNHSVEDIEEALAIARELSEADRAALRRGARPVDPQRLEDLGAAAELAGRFRAAGIPIEKIEDFANVLRKHSVEDIEEALRLKEMGLYGRLEKLLIEEDRARKDLVDELKQDLEAEIQAVGGRIDEFDGTITFPENALFSVGRHDILPRFLDTLEKMCPIWLEKLRKSASRREIEEILIEGHSSSEWSGAETKRDAWVLNLELSQLRAQAVLGHCLQLVEGTPAGDWSRAKLAAIGYSSSRPVLEEGGRENLRKSRRAVFRMRLSREQLRKEILKELQKENRSDVAR